LAGRRAKAGGISEAVLDIGVHAKDAGSRIFAAAKGALSAGLTIPHDESAMPSPERVKGQHVAQYSKHLSSEPEVYKRFFSRYLKHKLKPEELEAHVNETETKIMSPSTEAHK
jgi:large subunit ribosomal protein L18